MEYVKLQLRDTRSIAWRGASFAVHGMAIAILSYCCDQENGGVISGFAKLSDADLAATFRMTRADLDSVIASGLCAWSGEDLVCRLYDTVGHERLQLQRQQGEHGVKGGRPKKIGDNPKGLEADNPKGYEGITPSQPSIHPSRPASQPASRDTPVGVLAAVAAAGGCLEFQGEDLAGEWEEATKGLDAARVQAILGGCRRPNGERIRMPSGFAAARQDAERDGEARKAEQGHRQAEQRERARRAEHDAAVERDELASLAKARLLLAAIDRDPSIESHLPPEPRAWLASIRGSIAKGRPASLTLGRLLRHSSDLRSLLDPEGVANHG